MWREFSFSSFFADNARLSMTAAVQCSSNFNAVKRRSVLPLGVPHPSRAVREGWGFSAPVLFCLPPCQGTVSTVPEATSIQPGFSR